MTEKVSEKYLKQTPIHTPMQQKTEQVVLQRLEEIKEELDYIKENMLERDSFLSEEDKIDLQKAREEFAKGKTISLDALQKKLGL
ncbi:hypothetical protein HYX13_02380 [Candidatus Woesearchaeota archaeon]|nr:hypothetical protein [Candidatus Woesearchaeota archaeon]